MPTLTETQREALRDLGYVVIEGSNLTTCAHWSRVSFDLGPSGGTVWVIGGPRLLNVDVLGTVLPQIQAIRDRIDAGLTTPELRTIW